VHTLDPGRASSSSGEAPALERSRQRSGEQFQYHEFLTIRVSHANGQRCASTQRARRKALGPYRVFVAPERLRTSGRTRPSSNWTARGAPRRGLRGRPTYFSARRLRHCWGGGNPLYDWNVLRETGYSLWLIASHDAFALRALRLTIFIASNRYCEIPASSDSARDGRFVAAPGRISFFSFLSFFAR